MRPTGSLPSRSCCTSCRLRRAVLDGEVVASDADGRPNFARLHVRWTRPGTIHLWAFDLLAFNGRNLRPQPLVRRQACLQALLDLSGWAQ
jgi:bifunctional non-homologous end joining protein LigD